MTALEEAPAVYASGATPNLNKALSQLQGELPKVAKGKEGKVEGQNQAGKFYSYTYSYADLADVTDAAGPLLAKYGLAFHAAPTINPADRQQMILIWSLLHESGEERSGEWPLGRVDQKPQTLGSAVTYGRRYCLGAATGIVADDDDDGQRAQRDHGDRQSAGSAFDTGVPARPPQDRSNGDGPPAPENPPDVPAAEDGRRWADFAVEEAASFKTEAAGQKLWRDTAAAVIKGRCTPGEATHIQNIITARVADRRREASTRLLNMLSETDPWRDKVEELSDGDDEGARTALSELGRLTADGHIEQARSARISRAIIARFPKAVLKADVDG